MTNVLLIYADDMRVDFLPYMPNVQNLLVKPGRTFTQARCNVGLCGPSRAGLLNGQCSVHSGLISMGDEPDHDNTIGDWMQARGYRTGLVGKYHNATPALLGEARPPGWATWRQLIVDQTQYGYTVCDGTDVFTPSSGPNEPVPAQMDYLEAEALAFFAGRDVEDLDPVEPWFLLLTPSTPHWPFNVFPEDQFDWSHVKWPIVLQTLENSTDLPSWQAAAAVNQTPPTAPDSTDVSTFQEAARGQLRELNRLDRMIGSLVAALDASETLDETIIIFSSDNGLYYGEHFNHLKGYAKNDLYDVSLRVPLVIKGPGVTPGVSHEMVSIGIDITRTVGDIGGVLEGDRLSEPNARNLLDVINDPSSHATRSVLSSRKAGADPKYWQSPNPYAGDGITTSTRKLMRWNLPIGHPDRYEAYDLDADPHEHRNWAKDPVRMGERDTLEAQLNTLLLPLSDP